MITDFVNLLCGVLVLTGAAFILIAALGVLRLDDVFLRMHASTKAGTLGIGLVVLALAIWTEVEAVRVKAIVVVLFMVATAPIAAHLIGRAVYRSMSDAERERCRPEPKDAD